MDQGCTNDCADWNFVLSSAGAELLAWAAACKLGEFARAKELRSRTTPERAALITQTLELRAKAGTKFSRAAQMFFTREALEQATAEEVSLWRAKRYERAGAKRLADLCCATGGDAIGLTAVCPVTGFDLDPVRLRLAAANLAAYGRADRFTTCCADICTLSPEDLRADGFDAFFIDPARRDGERRIFDPEQYLPPLREILRWQRTFTLGAAKLGPGVELDKLPPEAEVEFISVGGELREAVLWLGNLAGQSASCTRRATLLPAGLSLYGENPDLGFGPVGDFLYEPDPAVIRAGYVRLAGSLVNALQLDPQIAYLTGNTGEQSPYLKCYQVLEWFDYEEKRLKKRLREMEIGNLEIKRRGSLVEPETLRAKLKLKGKNSATLFLTRCNNHPTAILARRLSPDTRG